MKIELFGTLKIRSMNAFENLNIYVQQCEPCIYNAKIIEFEELPDDERSRMHYYNGREDYILYCQKCNLYNLFSADVSADYLQVKKY